MLILSVFYKALVNTLTFNGLTFEDNLFPYAMLMHMNGGPLLVTLSVSWSSFF